LNIVYATKIFHKYTMVLLIIIVNKFQVLRPVLIFSLKSLEPENFHESKFRKTSRFSDT